MRLHENRAFAICRRPRFCIFDEVALQGSPVKTGESSIWGETSLRSEFACFLFAKVQRLNLQSKQQLQGGPCYDCVHATLHGIGIIKRATQILVVSLDES